MNSPNSRLTLRRETPSPLAMTSLALAMPLLLALLWTGAVFGYVRAFRPDVSHDSLLLLSVGLAMVGGGLFAIVGLLTGIVSLFERERPRTVPLAGMLLNSVCLLITFLLTSGPIR